MEQVKIDLIVGENDVKRVMDETLASAERLNESVDQIQGSADRTTKQMTEGFKTQQQAIIQATRAADDHRRTIEQNEKQIASINRAMDQERLTVLKLEKQYRRMGNQSTKEAQQLKSAIDRLNASLKESAADTKLLAQENVLANQAMEDLASQGDKAANQIKLTSFEAQNMRFQLTDLAVQIGSGQGIFRPLLQQGPQLVEALGGPRRAMKFFGQQAGAALKSVLSLRGGLILLATGFVGLIAVPIIAFFTKSAGAGEWLANKIAYLSGVFGELTNRLFSVGEALFNWATGAGSAADVADAYSKAIDNIGESLTQAGQDAQSFAFYVRQLEKAQREFIVTESRVNAQIAERRNLAEDERRSLGDRISQIREASRLESSLERQRLVFAEKQLENLRAQNIQGDGALKYTDEIAEAEAELFNLRSAAAQREFSDQQQIRALRNQAAEQRKEQIEALRELQKEAEKVRSRLRDLQNADAQGIDKIRLDGLAAAEEIDKLESSLRTLYAQRKQQFDLESEFEQLRSLTQARTSKQIEQFRIAELRKEEEFNQQRLAKERALAMSKLEQQKELALLLNETQRRNSLTEFEQERVKELEKLNIQREFAQRRLAIIAEQFGPTSPEANILRAQIELYRQQYESLANTDLTGLDLFRQKIMNALGLDDQGLQMIAGTFAQFGQTLTDTIIGVTEAQISEQERLIDAIANRVEETGAALEEQRKLQEQGFANDADLLQERLEAEQQLLEQAEQKKLALQKKAARQRLAIDAAQQASNYITTVTNLLASESSKGLIGLVTVLSGLALVANIVAKAKANAAEFQAQGFKDGTPWVTGPGTNRSDSVPAMLSVEERVVDAKSNHQIGRNVSNAELVKFYQIGKGIEAPSFAGIDNKAAAVVIQGQETSALEKQAQINAMERAFRSSASYTAQEMIAYWKTRPISYPTPEGTVIEMHEGGAKVRKVIKRK